MTSVQLGGLSVPEAALAWKFVRASGPGGQNVNKVSTAVECRLNVAAAGFAPYVRARLECLAGSRLNARGEVVVFADRHRTQARNRADALARLDGLVRAAQHRPNQRIPTKPSKAQRTRRLTEKKRRGEVKRDRRPPTDY